MTTNTKKTQLRTSKSGSAQQATAGKSVINIKTDKALKEEAQQVAKEMGVPLGTIINAYLREVVQKREVTFRAPEIPNERTQRELLEIEKDIQAGKNMDGPFETKEELDAFFDKLEQE